MNPHTPLSVLAVVLALVGVGLLVLGRRHRVTMRAYTSRSAYDVLRFSVPAGVVLFCSGGALYLASVGRFGRLPSPFGPIVLHDVARAALTVWLAGVAVILLTLVVVLVDLVRVQQ